MRYRELVICVKREYLDGMEAALTGAGFDSMQIDDSSVAREILNNPELYKYDYLIFLKFDLFIYNFRSINKIKKSIGIFIN